ncbi:MAG: hypothetical protein J6C27_00120 [Clostridia bacterium]|nr:hypothetical protein [Clostridia bacterium]
MKKRISALLAVVLTIALLASSFAMFGVNAENASTTVLPDEAEEITIGENKYVIEKASKYNAAKTMANALSSYDVTTMPMVTNAFANSVWEPKISNYWYDQPTVYAGNLYYIKGYNNGTGDYNALYTEGKTSTGGGNADAWATNHYQHSVAFVDDSLVASPWCSGYNNQYIDYIFHAPKDGDVLLYDVAGAIAPIGKDVTHFYGWKDNSQNKVEITIYKNDQKIWPADTAVDNTLTTFDDSVDISDLGVISLKTGDTIKIRFYEQNEDVNRNAVKSNLEIAYIYEPYTKVTVGDKEYDVLSESKMDVYSDFAALVDGKSLNDEVTFDDGWKMSIKYSDKGGWNNNPWGGTNAFKFTYCNTNPSDTARTGIKSDYYCSKNFYRGSVTFADSKDRVIVFPGMTDIENTYTPAPAIKLTYTVPRDGKVILFDSTGKITCKGLNDSPWWASEDAKHTVTVKIYKNGTEIWPADTGANNVIKLGADTIDFPDLGEMFVTKGDQFDIIFDSYVEWIDKDGTANDKWSSPRTGAICNPAVAYTEYLSPEYKYVNIGDSTYVVKNDSIFNARDTIWDLVDEMDATQYTAVDMSKSVWQAKLSYYAGSYAKGYTFATSKAVKVPTISQTTTDTGAWNTSWCQNSIAFHDDVIYVSPWVANDKTAAATVDMVFTAPKKGDIVIYDTIGSIVPHAQKSNTSPFYAWLANNKNEVSVTIYKNKVKIWPTDNTTDNKITAVDDMIVFPDLGSFKVYEGDTVTVRFQEEGVVNNRTDWNGDGKLDNPCGRDAVRADLEVAYLAVESPDPVTEMIQVGDKFYEVLIAEQYDAYAGLTDTVKDIPLGNAVSTNDKTGIVEFKGNWSMTYQYTSDKGFGFKPWGDDERFDIKYCEPYFATADKTKTPGIKGLQPAYYLSINNFNNCFFTSSILFLEDSKDLFISPSTAGAFTAESIDKTVQAPALKLTYTSNIDGKAVLYDRNGKFSGSGLANSPYWANENDKATVKIEIYHNNKKIWPTTNEAQIISKSNPEIAFPDLGELELKIGDKINYVFYANTESPATRAALICNPGIAFSEVTNKVSMDEANKVVKTDANFGTEVMVLVSVIVALGGVVVAMGSIAKKSVNN